MTYRDIDVRITRVEGFVLSSPYGAGNSLGQPCGVKSVGLVQVHTDAGISGLGETYAGIYAPELIAPTTAFLESFAIGRKVGDDTLLADIAGIPFIGRVGLVRNVASAIEIALWDIRGKLLEKPSYRLLGDRWRDCVHVYASGGSAACSPEEIIHDVAAVVDLGHTAYKMRIGFQPWDVDMQRVASASRALKGRDLMVDASMGTLRPPWSGQRATAAAEELAAFNLRWLEEPVHPDDVAGLSAVRHQRIVPIAAGEAYSSAVEYQRIFDMQAVDILQFDATHCGGIEFCVELARRAKASGLESAVHVWGSSVALAANAHTALATSDVGILEIPMVPLEVTKQMWVEPPIIRNGVWYASTAPGLGVELPDSVRKRYPMVRGSGYRLPKA